MTKFEHVSNDNHQISLAEGVVPFLTFPGGGGEQYITFPGGRPHHVTYFHEQTDTCENITFPQRYLRVVKKKKPNRSALYELSF